MMKIQLTKENMDELIEGVALTDRIKRTIAERGKSVKFNKDIKAIQVHCAKCKKWHDIEKLVDGEWVNANETYHTTNEGKKEKERFHSFCEACYVLNKQEQKDNKDEGVDEKVERNEVKTKISVEKNKKTPWSKENQRTVFFADEHVDLLLNYGFERGKETRKNVSINQVLYEILEDFVDRHPQYK